MLTFKDIYEKMRDYFLSQININVNFNIGSRIRSLFEAIATVLEELSFEADTEYHNLYIHSAFGDRLTYRARELGLDRKPAQKATGWFRFSGPPGTTIPSGTRVANGDPDKTANLLIFLTTQDGEIPETGELDLPIQAIKEGPEYNLPARALNFIIDEIRDITNGYNPGPTSGGTNEESDEDLRYRCYLAPYRQARTIERFWESLACDIIGVAQAKCCACAPHPGAFQILVWSRDAEGRLVPANSDLLTRVQEYLTQFAPACITLSAVAPTGSYQNIIAYLKVAQDYEFEQLMPQVKSAIESVFNSLLPGQTLTRARLITAAMNITGVENFFLSQPNTDITPLEDELILPGSIAIYPWEWDQKFPL